MFPLPQWQVHSDQGSVLFDNEDKNLTMEIGVYVITALAFASFFGVLVFMAAVSLFKDEDLFNDYNDESNTEKQ